MKDKRIFITSFYSLFLFIAACQTKNNLPLPVAEASITAYDEPFTDIFAPNMVLIKGGTYKMGDIFNEGDLNEIPVHTVKVADFLLGKNEVTQAEYEKIMGKNPSHYGECLKCPADQVSWEDANLFIKKLNERSGRHYRLPTEEEWEYAARSGGKKHRFGNGKNSAKAEEMNFDASSTFAQKYSESGLNREKPMPVGSFTPNELGLYDMSGNVWEWCSSTYEKYIADDFRRKDTLYNYERRVLRGGSWHSEPKVCRTTQRNRAAPSSRDANTGFRLACDK